MTIPRNDGNPSIPLPQQALRAVADLLGGDRIIAYRPYFAHAFDGAANAVLLSQFWFWTNTPTVKAREGGWFYKSQSEITEETGLTRREILTARRDLTAMQVLEEDLRGVPATMHYRLNKDAIYFHLWRYMQAHPDKFAQNVQTESPETGKLVRGKRANKPVRSARTITETTSENKTKKTQKAGDSPSVSGGEEEQRRAYLSGAAKFKQAVENAKKGGAA